MYQNYPLALIRSILSIKSFAFQGNCWKGILEYTGDIIDDKIATALQSTTKDLY